MVKLWMAGFGVMREEVSFLSRLLRRIAFRVVGYEFIGDWGKTYQNGAEAFKNFLNSSNSIEDEVAFAASGDVN